MLKSFRNIVAVAAASLLMAGPVLAEWQPSGPISLWVGFGAGGSTDTLSRALAKSVEEDTGWKIVVENVPGGGGIAMLSRLQAAAADGRSLGVGVTTPVGLQLKTRGDQLPFTLESFDWLTTMGKAGLVLAVRSDSASKTFDDLLAAAKNGPVTVATSGPAQEIILRAIVAKTGANFVSVPVKSDSETIQNLLGGHVNASMFGGTHQEYVTAGSIAVVAGLAPTRDPAAPEVPTVMEMGLPFAIDASFYIAAPAGLPPEAHAALVAAFQTALARPAMQEAMVNVAVEPVSLSPEATAALLREGLANIGTMIDAAAK